jgi:hypothetical protein
VDVNRGNDVENGRTRRGRKLKQRREESEKERVTFVKIENSLGFC